MLKQAASKSLPFYNQQNKGNLPQWQCWSTQAKVLYHNLYHNLPRLGTHPQPKQVPKIKQAPKCQMQHWRGTQCRAENLSCTRNPAAAMHPFNKDPPSTYYVPSSAKMV